MEQCIAHQTGIGIITLAGRFDSAAAPLFDAWFEENDQPESRRYLLDLTEVSYVTSAGMRSILKLLKLLERRAGKLALCGVAKPVQDVFAMSGFTPFFTLYDSLATALAEFERH